jgi:hypothetical protein
MLLNGNIYKIVYIIDPSIYYIGSTLSTLEDRYDNHIFDYEMWSNGQKKYISSIGPYFYKYDIKNFKIELIKAYKVVDEKHLRVYETLWILKSKPINTNIPFAFTVMDFYKKYHRNKYYIENKEKFLEYNKKNNEKNKEKRKQHYEENKDKIKEKNKDKYKCLICNYNTHLKWNYNTHLKSNKHIKNE